MLRNLVSRFSVVYLELMAIQAMITIIVPWIVMGKGRTRREEILNSEPMEGRSKWVIRPALKKNAQ